MRKFSRIFEVLFFLHALSSSAFAQEGESVWSFSLDSVTVQGQRYMLPVKTNNRITNWDISQLNQLPQILGNADPVHYAQMLPGIQTNSEYRSGINIEGCDNQHNLILIDGIPIYNVNHLLGFFSAFNSSHFSSLSIAKGLVSSGSPNRLGGQLEMLHNVEIPDSASGSVSLGLISSEGTIRLPVTRKTSVTASLRASYINMLYSAWLKAEGQQINYSFYDANVSILHQLNNNNSFVVDFYSGVDEANFSQGQYVADINAQWGNMMGGVHWRFAKDRFYSRTTAYYTSYKNRCRLDMPDMAYRLPSGIFDFGLKGDYVWDRWDNGFEAIVHSINPQSLDQQGTFFITDSKIPSYHCFEGSIYSNYDYSLTDKIRIKSGIRGSIFNREGTTYSAIDPSISFQYEKGDSQFSITYGVRHQYLFQVGFSDLGLPTEFWISAGKGFKPQYAHELSAVGSSYLFGHRFKLTVDLFYRRLYHQLGYKESILDFVNNVYDINRSLMHGRGENYGFSFMIDKCIGRLTGWMSYTYIHARRSFDEIRRKKSYPASHERPHELNAVLTYSLTKHWNFGSTLVFASGTPFTAAKSLYLLNNNIIIQHGDFNANRLHPYMRLDLSINYKWGRKEKHGLNFSLYNVTSHDNELFYYISTKKKGSFVYRPLTFVIYALPSISYYYKF